MIQQQTSCKGKFIVLEGVEGVGKSTQVKQLSNWLTSKGIQAITTREPGGTPIAESIRQLVLAPNEEEMCAETELLMMMAARLQHWNGFILPHLQQGHWVICDRFIDSTVAYQGAGRGISETFIRRLHHEIAPQMKADIVIVLDMSLEQAWERVKSRGQELDRMEQASQDFFVRARACFLNAVQEFPNNYVSIHGGDSPEIVAREIQAQIDARLFERGSS